MLTSNTLRKFATLLSAIFEQERKSDTKQTFKTALSPEVTSQAGAIEECLYGLLDRLTYSHLDRHGKPIHLSAKTARAFMETVKSVQENEGNSGNAPDRWYNILTRFPEGTLDGVLKVEHDVIASNGEILH